MKVSKAVAEFFESRQRTNMIATSDADGTVNVGVYGSPMLADESRVRMMLGDNRTYANLQQNPSAALMVTMHGTTGFGMKGCRLYLKLAYMKDEGEEFDQVHSAIRERIGDAADMLKHLVMFDILEARPIVDFGQGI